MHPRDGQRGFVVMQKNGCGNGLLSLPQLFRCNGGETTMMQTESEIVLTKAEKQLINLVRKLDYGEIRVMIKENRPIRVEEIRRSIQLTDEK